MPAAEKSMEAVTSVVKGGNLGPREVPVPVTPSGVDSVNPSTDSRPKSPRRGLETPNPPPAKVSGENQFP